MPKYKVPATVTRRRTQTERDWNAESVANYQKRLQSLREELERIKKGEDE